jgi:hypothetical protein
MISSRAVQYKSVSVIEYTAIKGILPAPERTRIRLWHPRRGARTVSEPAKITAGARITGAQVKIYGVAWTLVQHEVVIVAIRISRLQRRRLALGKIALLPPSTSCLRI